MIVYLSTKQPIKQQTTNNKAYTCKEKPLFSVSTHLSATGARRRCRALHPRMGKWIRRADEQFAVCRCHRSIHPLKFYRVLIVLFFAYSLLSSILIITFFVFFWISHHHLQTCCPQSHTSQPRVYSLSPSGLSRLPLSWAVLPPTDGPGQRAEEQSPIVYCATEDTLLAIDSAETRPISKEQYVPIVKMGVSEDGRMLACCTTIGILAIPNIPHFSTTCTT